MNTRTLTVAAWIGALAGGPALAQSTTRISVTSGGAQLAGNSSVGPLSSDGRYVVFRTSADGVVAGDANGLHDGFVIDRATGAYDWVTVAVGGAAGNGDSVVMDMTPDARFVAIQSSSSNMVAGDGNGKLDVFVRDRQLGVTTRVSVDSSGLEGNGDSINGSLSADGRFVAFNSGASNLVTGDTNHRFDVFVHDRQTGQTTRASVSSSGAEADFGTWTARISGDGGFVVYESQATNLVALDSNGGGFDVFVHELATGTTELVSLDAAGVQFPGGSQYGRISHDGRYVAFARGASAPAGTPKGIFVRDTITGQTTSFDPTPGGQCNTPAVANMSMTPDARFLSFASDCPLLVAGDTNNHSDVFVLDRATGGVSRVGSATDGTQGNADAGAAQFSSDGRYVAFESLASNLVVNDSNGAQDVFLRDRQQPFFRDADVDAYGDPAVSQIDISVPPGFVDNDDDCNDADASVHPGAADFCNGIDDDCDQLVDEGVTHCTPIAVFGVCSARMFIAGTPSVSASSGFDLRVEQLPANISALVFYGTSPIAPPFQNPGQRCVASPLQRLPLLNSGGASGCVGQITYDWLAYMTSHPGTLGQPLFVGESIYAQAWYRDPLSPTLPRFSEAIEFRMCP
jgi:Tol biopolymer transport system component